MNLLQIMFTVAFYFIVKAITHVIAHGRLYKRSHSNHLRAKVLERFRPSFGLIKECALRCESNESCTAVNMGDSCCMLLSTVSGNAILIEPLFDVFHLADGCPSSFGFRYEFGHGTKNGGLTPSCYSDVDMNRAAGWYTARQYCQGLGADLVSIETAGEQRFLENILPRHSSPPAWAQNKGWYGYWLSGQLDKKINSFVWLATGEQIDYQNFYPGEPRLWPGNPTLLIVENRGFKWDDSSSPIDDINGIICETRPAM